MRWRSAPTRSPRTSRTSKRQREEADKLLAEYRERLKEAREQADDITARARKASETAMAEATADGKAKREELVAAARRDIEAETRRSLEQIRKEVADLTVIATEKVTRKSLTPRTRSAWSRTPWTRSTSQPSLATEEH